MGTIPGNVGDTPYRISEQKPRVSEHVQLTQQQFETGFLRSLLGLFKFVWCLSRPWPSQRSRTKYFVIDEALLESIRQIIPGCRGRIKTCPTLFLFDVPVNSPDPQRRGNLRSGS